MKTPYESRQWHDLETLKEVTQSYKYPTNYKSKFTSIDRISELQEIVHLTTAALESYSIESEDKCNSLRNELSILRGYLVGIIGEFEGSIYELERLATALHVSLKESVAEAEILATVPEQSDIEAIAEFDQPNEHPDSEDSLGSTLRRNQTQTSTSTVNAGQTRRNLLGKLRQRGYKVEQHANGKWLTSLSDYPDEDTREIFLKLLDLGLVIWPGSRFLW